MNKGLPRHEVWRMMYRKNRYCRHLNQQELAQRIRDVFTNLLLLTPEAKIGVHPPTNPDGVKWMELWTHVLEEMELRHGPFPNGFGPDVIHRETLPNLVGELASKAAGILAAKGLRSGDVFIKYGKAEHMRSLYENGAMRIQPASYYAASTHNGAIRDDELSLTLSLALSRDDILKIVINPQDVPEGPIEKRLEIKTDARADYWLYCVTTGVQSRLFVDFAADSCVIIKDKDRFMRLLDTQGAQELAGTRFRYGQATYVDPLLPKTGIIDVPMSKHFRYEYQSEYRFVWIPEQRSGDLSYRELEVGPLESFSELVVL